MTAVLEDHGLHIAPDGCGRLRAWADVKIREDPSARGQGDLHDLPINRTVLGQRIGAAATETLLGHVWAFNAERYKQRKHSHFRQTTLAQGIARASRAYESLLATEPGLRLGAPSMNIVVLEQGEAFEQHYDRCALTINVPLTPSSDFAGGKMYHEVDGRMVKSPMHMGHAYSHEGKVEHGVTKVTRGRRYTLAIHCNVRLAPCPPSKAALTVRRCDFTQISQEMWIQSRRRSWPRSRRATACGKIIRADGVRRQAELRVEPLSGLTLRRNAQKRRHWQSRSMALLRRAAVCHPTRR